MNEIITFGQGYKLEPGIKVFVKSAKRFCDRLTILCTDLSPELIDFLKEQQVNIVDTKETFAKFNVNVSLSPYTLKVIYFYLYCKHISKATNVYLCDFTDIFVQKNVFELIKQEDKIYVTSENKLIRDCSTNSTWINICYNFDILNNLLGKKEIINGGNILGNREICLDLLKEMCLDMQYIIKRIGNYQNIDQASLNKVVYFDQLNYCILKNKEIVNLIHSSSMLDFTNTYVIHQYDANKTLEKKLYEKYV